MSAFESGNSITEKCYARIGVMGNPSDGFEGKTLSALIGNFWAEVTISEFSSLEDLHEHTLVNGYYGGLRLLQATCRVFFDYLCKSGMKETVLASHRKNGFMMSYDTSIPRCVGLSGSSAIIVAAFRCLLHFHGNLKLADLGIAKDIFPSIILSIEKSELKISAGLQDRVIQTYGGLVHMDFTPGPALARAPSEISMSALHGMRPGGVYTPHDPALLPAMYLAYNTNVGGESGTVHNTVAERWKARDEELVSSMKTLGVYADEALAALKVRNYMLFATYITKNFRMRRKVYGDAVVGARNLKVVDLAEDSGMAAKFTGSGGAILMVRNDHDATAGTFFDADIEASISTAFKEHAYEFVRVAIPPSSENTEMV
eukprot:GSChrysophyteH1.ASY1.ANO1.3003.1 assembled CDS